MALYVFERHKTLPSDLRVEWIRKVRKRAISALNMSKGIFAYLDPGPTFLYSQNNPYTGEGDIGRFFPYQRECDLWGATPMAEWVSGKLREEIWRPGMYLSPILISQGTPIVFPEITSC